MKLKTDLVLFDVDKTLFDTPKFNEEIHKSIAELANLQFEEIIDIKNQYSQKLKKFSDFHPKEFHKFIAQKTNIDLDQIEQIFYNPDLYKKNVFPDVAPAIDRLSRSHQLGIYTEAVLSWQETKLKLSGLDQLFDPEMIFILRRKVEPKFLNGLPPVTIIDDSPEVIEELDEFDHITSIFIDRYQDENQIYPNSITSLDQLLPREK